MSFNSEGDLEALLPFLPYPRLGLDELSRGLSLCKAPANVFINFVDAGHLQLTLKSSTVRCNKLIYFLPC